MSIFGYEFFSLQVVCFVEYEMSMCCSTSSPHSEGQSSAGFSSIDWDRELWRIQAHTQKQKQKTYSTGLKYPD